MHHNLCQKWFQFLTLPKIAKNLQSPLLTLLDNTALSFLQPSPCADTDYRCRAGGASGSSVRRLIVRTCADPTVADLMVILSDGGTHLPRKYDSY